jgi:NADPH-dependent 2,4-dienoyl-CoA reductase/sulfur reductase-like enzyme/rhodanese-related sulfurtransferase
MKTVIIGGVAAGMSAATRLRRLDENAEIVVLEMGENVSYANCGLPYFVSDVISDRDALLLQTPESLHKRFNLDVRTNSQVTSIEPSAKTVTVRNLPEGTTYIEGYDFLVITTGAKPRRPAVDGIDRAISLRDVADADALRSAASEAARQGMKTAVIIGGGFIGVEVAENLRKLDFEVSIVQRGESLLSGFDPEIIEPLQKHLESHSVKIHLAEEVTKVTNDSVLLSSGAALPAAVLISAAGVEPDNKLAQAAGLRIGPTGGLWVDDQQRTSDPSIFAAGDAVEKNGMLTDESMLIPLANLANRHGRLIADVIAGVETKSHASIGTAIVGAFEMVVAKTGLSESEVRRQALNFSVVHVHPNNHAGYYPGASRVSIKVIFENDTGRILGAQAVGGEGVDKRIDVIATAILAGLHVDSLMDLELSYAPQFGSAKDAVNMAGYVANNVFHKTTPTIQWHELDEAMAEGAQLIDVRSHSEHQAGSIPGAKLIPVDELRGRLDEISKSKVIVHCAVGQRGHTATQILRAHGIEVRNLDGGYATWRAGQDALARTNGR